MFHDDSEVDWMVSIYPNPAEKQLYVKFELADARELIIKLIDVTGRTVMIQKARHILPGETIELNISRLSPALYLLQISTPNQTIRKNFYIQKI
jgi:hypothetical protein